MATKQATMDYILDQLSGIGGVSARKMFGEYTLYCGGKVVALVCDDTLFVKATDGGRAFVGGQYAEGEAYPGAKPSILVEGDLIEDREWLAKLIEITALHLPEPKPKAQRAKKARRG